MKDTLLTPRHKSQIAGYIKKADYKKIIAILDSISTKHSGTAKMKDKRYVIAEIVRHITEANHKNPEREFYKAGLSILKLKSDNAKEVVFTFYGADTDTAHRQSPNGCLELQMIRIGKSANTPPAHWAERLKKIPNFTQP